MWLDLEAGILEEFAAAQRATPQPVDPKLSRRFVSDFNSSNGTERGADGLTDRQREAYALMSAEMRERWARRRR